MKECIVILGMHRSGTSVLSGLVSLQGFYLGADEMPPRDDNPIGFFENMKVYHLNQSILEAYGTSWDDYFFTMDQIKPDDLHQYLLAAKEIIREEFGPVKRTFIKDPRMCLLFPLWEKALTEMGFKIKVILAYRSPMEVAHSLKARNQMELEKSLLMWSHYFFQAEKISRQYQRMVVHYSNDFQDMDAFFTSLGKFLGVEISEEMLASAYQLYTPKLKHHQLQMDNLSDELPAYLKNFIKILGKGKLTEFEALDEIIGEFYNSQRLYLYNDVKLNKKIEDLEIELHDTTKDLKQAIHESIKKLEEKNTEINLAQRVYDRLDRDLQSTKDSLETERLQKIAEIKKGIDQSRVGDEIFHTIFENNAWKNKFSRIEKDSKYFKTKRALLPFTKSSSKRFLEDKIKIIESGLFSSFYYLTHHPEAWKLKVDPLNFYNKHGWKAGHNPGPHFNTRDYLTMYDDVAQSGVNPLLHYIEYGKKQGRFPKFPTSSYQGDDFEQAIFGYARQANINYHGPTKGEILSIEKNIVTGWLLTESTNSMPIIKVNNRPTRSMGFDLEIIDDETSTTQVGFFKSKLLTTVENKAAVELLLLNEDGITSVQKKTINNNSLIPNKFTDLEKAYEICNKPDAVAITVWEGAHNPIGRAKVLYDIVASKRPAVIFAYVFGDFGSDLWMPLRNAGIPIVLIPYADRLSYQAYIQERKIKFNTVWICKHRLHSFELASFIAKKDTACILDLDDNEDVFVSSKGSESKPYGIFSKNKANYYLSKVRSRSVASVSIQEQYGGKLMRHARKSYQPEQTIGRALESKTAVFIGTIRPHKNVTELVDAVTAFNRNSKEKIKLAIGGDFNPPALRQTLDTPDTIILDEIATDDLYDTLAAYDIIITGYPDNSSENQDINKLQITAKIGDGLAIGKPVLTPFSPSVADLGDISGLFIFNKGNFNQQLEAAMAFNDEVSLPKEFTLAHSYETFKSLEGSAKKDSLAKDIFELEPLYDYWKNPPTDQKNIVLVWKQHDSGIYGRRIDLLARYYKQHNPDANVTVLEVMGAGSLSNYENSKALFDNSSVIMNDVLSQKIYRYRLDNVDYHLITYNDETGINSFEEKFNGFLTSENIYPDNSVIILFPLLEVSDQLLNAVNGFKIIVDIVDNQVQWMKMPEVRLKGLKQYYELISIANQVVANSPTNLEYFDGLNFFENLEPHFIPNWYTLPDGFAFKREINQGEINLIYSGNLNDRIDWNLMHKICKMLVKFNGKLHIVGSTVRRADEMKKLLKNENCIYHGVVSEKQLLRLLQHINFAVVPHTEDRISKFMDPIKLKMYKKLGITSLTSKLPSLPSDDPMLVLTESSDDFMSKLDNMLKDCLTHSTYAFENTSEDEIGNQYLAVINNLLS